jgi:4-amino-4-deoxy-L-arabinose transferase-like glycosyltransferase
LSRKKSSRRREPTAAAARVDDRPRESVGADPAPSAAAPARPWAELACGLAALGVYGWTLAPTIVGGDSGELAAVGATLGVAHPPGYPLYTLLAKVFTLLPWGGVALRVNLLSACCSAAAAALLCRAVGRWTGDAWSGVLAAGTFALSPLVWPYAVTAEVFPLNNLLVAALLLLVVRSEEAGDARRPRLLVAFAFVSGLALSNHHTSVFVIAPFGAYLLWRARGVLGRRALWTAAAAGLLGLSPYLYLPWAAARHPLVAFGDPSSWNGFWAHLLRHEYGTFRLASEDVGASGFWGARVVHVLGVSARATFGLAPALLVLAGAPVLRWIRSREAHGPRTSRGRLAALVFATLALYVGVFAALANVRWDDALHRTVQDRFWQQATLLVAALMGVGLCELRERTGRAGRLLAPGLAIAGTVALAAAHWRAGDHRGRTFFADYGRAILEPLPPRAILLVTSDEAVGAVRYLQSVEGLRPDVRILPTGQLTRPWLRGQAERLGVVLPAGDAFRAREFLDANVPRSPVFVVNRVPWLATLEEAYALWPQGVAEEVTRKGEPPALDAWLARVDDAYRRFDPRAGQRFPSGTWERYVSENVGKLDRRFGLALPTAASQRTDREAAARAVVRGLNAYVARQPEPDAAAHKNLGVAYQLLAAREPDALGQMARHWTIALALKPDDPDRDAMRRLIAQAASGARTTP